MKKVVFIMPLLILLVGLNMKNISAEETEWNNYEGSTEAFDLRTSNKEYIKTENGLWEITIEDVQEYLPDGEETWPSGHFEKRISASMYHGNNLVSLSAIFKGGIYANNASITYVGYGQYTFPYIAVSSSYTVVNQYTNSNSIAAEARYSQWFRVGYSDQVISLSLKVYPNHQAVISIN